MTSASGADGLQLELRNRTGAISASAVPPHLGADTRPPDPVRGMQKPVSELLADGFAKMCNGSLLSPAGRRRSSETAVGNMHFDQRRGC